MEAIKRGVKPRELTDKVHSEIVRLLKEWGIGFDNYTRTESETHKRFVRDFYMKIYNNGFIFTKVESHLYCENCERFLPDRFVVGTCPYCGYPHARGDQCENCGRLLEPTQLIEPRCSICGSKPVVRESKHWYFDLPKLQEAVQRYIEENPNFTEAVKNYSLNYMREGLKPRALTRDNKWGIPAPFPGADGKTIYVWMEAVLGYISATIEYFERLGDPEGWKKFWFDPEARTLYFIGKDNIPFHTIIFPALLLATREGYNLPWDVSATEFLTYERKKFSKTHGIGIWMDEALKLAPADYWRYALLYLRPEGKDTDFSLRVFEELVNSHLNDTLGNFIHRTLLFVWRNFDGRIPKPASELGEEDSKALEKLRILHGKITNALERIKIKEAVELVMEVAREGNRYLNTRAPWKLIKTRPEEAATVIYVASQYVKALSILIEPIMPFTAEKLRRLINLQEPPSWDDALSPLEPGHPVNKPKPLFKKVKAEELVRKLEEMRGAVVKRVDVSEFRKLDLRIGRVVEASYCPESRKYVILRIDVGDRVVQMVGRLGEHYSPEDLKGKLVVVLTNLKPRRICEQVSEAMLLAADDEGTPVLLKPEKDVEPGSKVF